MESDYGLDDRYRGIKQSRRIVLMCKKDMERLGIKTGTMVDLTSHFEGDTLIVGKPVGNDLRNGIVTLPTLYAMENTKLKDKVNHFFEYPNENSIHEEIVDLIRSSNGVERSINYASSLATQARESLTNLPINSHRTSLEGLAEFIISRGT